MPSLFVCFWHCCSPLALKKFCQPAQHGRAILTKISFSTFKCKFLKVGQSETQMALSERWRPKIQVRSSIRKWTRKRGKYGIRCCWPRRPRPGHLRNPIRKSCWGLWISAASQMFRTQRILKVPLPKQSLDGKGHGNKSMIHSWSGLVQKSFTVWISRSTIWDE